jgi:hypothetical protein
MTDKILFCGENLLTEPQVTTKTLSFMDGIWINRLKQGYCFASKGKRLLAIWV